MTTSTLAPNNIALATAAARAALAVLPTGQPLTVGDVGSATVAPSGGQAVTATFGGAATGEVVVVVSAEVADALRNSPLGELDLTQAVMPALEAAASTLGPVVLNSGQALDAAVALDSLAAKGDPVFVPLLHEGTPSACVALLLTPWPVPVEAPTGTTAAGGPRSSAHGLDLLHDVEMEVAAELGRTHLSVRELLALTPGAVVELDRAAGSPSDLLVNGRLIARGEVVVMDENFGIRITEILPPGTDRF